MYSMNDGSIESAKTEFNQYSARLDKVSPDIEVAIDRL